MIQTVTESMFIDSFMGGYKDNFSYEGKKALFKYLDNVDVYFDGKELELDPIAFCCEYTEYESLAEFNREYGETCKEIEDVSNLTSMISIDGFSFIIQCY